MCITCQISIEGREGRWFGMNIVLWNLKSDCAGSLLLLWQLPLRDFAVLTCRSRSVRKEINPWWVAEEGEMRSLVSGSDEALKPRIGSSWTWREEWSYMVTDSLPVCSHLKANKTPGGLLLSRVVVRKTIRLLFERTTKSFLLMRKAPLTVLLLENTSLFH